ncbi:MAG TPA: GAF domain-containing protein [Gemmatimonadaceae bacterium]|nr:GAF domain-containing protein [Gemmatimonadaceae bacterium]
MHVVHDTRGLPKAEAYQLVLEQVSALLEGERDGLANASNTAALLYEALPDLNWVGFYFLRGGELVVGPFQGKVACVRIAMGKGVCGTAAVERRTVIVPDVNEYPGHIVCDAASQSEVVIPLVHQGRVLGVFDIDGSVRGRFDDVDAAGLESVAALLLEGSDWDWLPR